MKKLLSILATVGLTATATATIVSCGSQPAPQKENLKDVIKFTQVKGSEFNTQESVLAQILELNSDSGIKVSDVELEDFKPATQIADGSAKLVAKSGTKYQGEVPITITALAKTALSDVVKVTSVKGDEANDQDAVLAKLQELNDGLDVSAVELTDFKEATQIADGSAKLVAKSGTKYQGEVPITITKLSPPSPEKLDLKDVFLGFEFKDQYNIKTFLDYNSSSIIDQQILTYLDKESLSNAGLTIKEWTSNSITLQAKTDSNYYQGEVTLSWNLKLFEVWGVLTDSPITGSSNNELKGYFYLNSNQEIKYFDAYAYFKQGQSNEITKYDTLHSFEFKNENQESKLVSFLQKYKTSEIAPQLGSFTLTKRTTVTIMSRIATNIKIYDSINDKWNSILDIDNILDQPITLEIDAEGIISSSNNGN